jgi:hypothetical protein
MDTFTLPADEPQRQIAVKASRDCAGLNYEQCLRRVAELNAIAHSGLLPCSDGRQPAAPMERPG